MAFRYQSLLLVLALYSARAQLPTQDDCNGCADSTQSNCYKMIADRVYACRGTFSGGVSDGQSICGTNYEICSNIPQLESLELNASICGAIPRDAELFVTLISSQGSALCSQLEVPLGTNDVWGCARESPTNVVETFDDNPLFGCAGVLNAFWSTDSQASNPVPNWSAGDGLDELNTIALSNGANGGVMCCPVPTPAPSNSPSTSPTTTPTAGPSESPTTPQPTTPQPTNSPISVASKDVLPVTALLIFFIVNTLV